MEVTIQLETAHRQLELFGQADSHLRLLRDELDVQITARQSNLIISGKAENVNKAAEVIDKMQKHLLKRGVLTTKDIHSFLIKEEIAVTGEMSKAMTVFSHKKVIEPNTRGQLKYIDAMLSNDLTFCIGPAGTGKTYLAVAVAVSMLKKKQVRRIAGAIYFFIPGLLQLREKHPNHFQVKEFFYFS